MANNNERGFIKIMLPNGVEVNLTPFFDPDEGEGIDIRYTDGEFIGEMMGSTIPDKDDPDYSEVVERLSADICAEFFS